MTQRIGNLIVIEAEPDEPCALCGKMAEVRPAGPNKERVCYDCALKNPQAMDRYTTRLFTGSDIQ